MGDAPPIPATLVDIINFLAYGVGIVVVLLIVVGGFQYATAGGAPQKIEAAKRRIIQALVALGLFIFMYAILQWAIPGGVFNSQSTTCQPNPQGGPQPC